jgi:hypothetical protein
MTTLEKTIFDKVRQLDPDQQQRVLEFLESLQSETFDFAGWWEQVKALQTELRQQYGDQYTVGVQGLLDELREEASWPRW